MLLARPILIQGVYQVYVTDTETNESMPVGTMSEEGIVKYSTWETEQEAIDWIKGKNGRLELY